MEPHNLRRVVGFQLSFAFFVLLFMSFSLHFRYLLCNTSITSSGQGLFLLAIFLVYFGLAYLIQV